MIDQMPENSALQMALLKGTRSIVIDRMKADRCLVAFDALGYPFPVWLDSSFLVRSGEEFGYQLAVLQVSGWPGLFAEPTLHIECPHRAATIEHLGHYFRVDNQQPSLSS